jgi:hypothetical protein
MQKLTCLLFCLFSFGFVQAQNAYTVKLLEQNANGLLLDIKIYEPKFVEVFTDNGVAYKPVLHGVNAWQVKGAPDLPKINVSLAIPGSTDTKIEIMDAVFSEKNIAIAPSKGKIVRPNTPEKTPFEFGDQYKKDAFFPENVFTINAPYIFRSARGQALHIAPMQYNAQTKTLRTYSSMRVKVSFQGENKFNALPNNVSITSPLYAEIYKAHFVNDVPTLNPSAYTAIGDKGSMLVLSPGKYISHIAKFVEWKKQKGIPTTLVNIDTISGGTSDVNIRAFVKKYYLANMNTFLVLVGNATDVPTINLLYTEPTLHGPGDNAYAYISGISPFLPEADHYPEFIVGRLMARDSNDIKVQVQKIINY